MRRRHGATFQSHPVGIGTHIFASALALLLGPFQFSRRLRYAGPALHRWMGRIDLGVAVAVGEQQAGTRATTRSAAQPDRGGSARVARVLNPWVA